jgi:hypothetical protein
MRIFSYTTSPLGKETTTSAAHALTSSFLMNEMSTPATSKGRSAVPSDFHGDDDDDVDADDDDEDDADDEAEEDDDEDDAGDDNDGDEAGFDNSDVTEKDGSGGGGGHRKSSVRMSLSRNRAWSLVHNASSACLLVSLLSPLLLPLSPLTSPTPLPSASASSSSSTMAVDSNPAARAVMRESGMAAMPTTVSSNAAIAFFCAC